MSNLMKIAIPLLNEQLELKDIQDCSGFVNAYFEDINKPALDYHLFMMYDPYAKGDNIANCFYKLNKLNNKYSMRVAYIKGKPYYIYTFTINKTIDLLRDGNIFLSTAQKQRVLQFWDWKDAWITNNILLGVLGDTPDNSRVPEEDYAPDLSETIKGEILE